MPLKTQHTHQDGKLNLQLLTTGRPGGRNILVGGQYIFTGGHNELIQEHSPVNYYYISLAQGFSLVQTAQRWGVGKGDSLGGPPAPLMPYDYKCFHFIFIVVVICLYLLWICAFGVFTYRRPSLKPSRCPPQHLPGRWKSRLWKAARQKPQTAARWRTTARVLRPEESTAGKCGNTTGKQTEWLIFVGKAEQ